MGDREVANDCRTYVPNLGGLEAPMPHISSSRQQDAALLPRCQSGTAAGFKIRMPVTTLAINGPSSHQGSHEHEIGKT